MIAMVYEGSVQGGVGGGGIQFDHFGKKSIRKSLAIEAKKNHFILV